MKPSNSVPHEDCFSGICNYAIKIVELTHFEYSLCPMFPHLIQAFFNRNSYLKSDLIVSTKNCMTETLLNWNWTIFFIQTEAEMFKISKWPCLDTPVCRIRESMRKRHWAFVSKLNLTFSIHYYTTTSTNHLAGWKAFFYCPNMMDLSGMGWEKIQTIYHC